MSVPVHTGFLKTMWLLEITVALFFRGEQLRNQSLSHHKGTRKHASLLPPQGQTCKTLLSSVWLVPHIKSNHYDAPKVSVLSPLETKKKKSCATTSDLLQCRLHENCWVAAVGVGQPQRPGHQNRQHLALVFLFPNLHQMDHHLLGLLLHHLS